MIRIHPKVLDLISMWANSSQHEEETIIEEVVLNINTGYRHHPYESISNLMSNNGVCRLMRVEQGEDEIYFDLTDPASCYEGDKGAGLRLVDLDMLIEARVTQT